MDASSGAPPGARPAVAETARETLESLQVIDADVHVHENPAELAEYASAPWDVALREIARVGKHQLDRAGAVFPGLAPWANFQVPFPGGSNRRQVVTSVAEMRRELDELQVGVFNIAGAYHAIPNLCPHQRGPLCDGSLSGTLDYGPHTGWRLEWIWDGEIVTCPWHGLEFHVPSGQCLALSEVRLRKFEIRVVAGEVRVVV
jgi:nitrite reductase (NADH) small subunit